jgi:uncharacterized protein
MNKHLLFSLLRFLIVIIIFANNPVFAENPEPGLLWKISGNNLKSPSYLYGTIHLICPDDVIINDGFKSYFNQTKQLVMEVDMSDPQMMQKAMALMISPDRSNLKDKLSKEDVKLVNDFLTRNFGVGLSQLGVYKPFALISMVVLKYLPCPQPASYETILTQMASENKMKVIGLETIEYQIELIDQLSDEMTKELVRSIREFDEQKATFIAMIEAYKSQDLNKLDKIMEESGQQMGMMDVLLDRRNEEWIPLIEKLIKEQSSFIAVGAGHLGSDKGVVKLLREKGYTVEPIRF